MKVEGDAYQITINETTFKGRIVDGKRIDLNMPGAAQRHFRGEFVGDTFKAWVFNAAASGSGPSITPCRETFDLVRAGAPAAVAKAEPPPQPTKPEPPVQPAPAAAAPTPMAQPQKAAPPKAEPARVEPAVPAPVAKAPEPPPPAAVAAPSASDAVELAFWDTIRRTSRPTSNRFPMGGLRRLRASARRHPRRPHLRRRWQRRRSRCRLRASTWGRFTPW
jgi:hypothetical protein